MRFRLTAIAFTGLALAVPALFAAAGLAQTQAPAQAAPPPVALPPNSPARTASDLVRIEGRPSETRPPEKRDEKPAFPGQTRAPYHASPAFRVTVLTDKLHEPWSLAVLPDGRLLVTERERPAAMRLIDGSGALSAPLTGLDALTPPGSALGLLDVVLARDFASSHRIFFAFYERGPDGAGNTNLARATLDAASGALRDVTRIFTGLPVLPAKDFSKIQGGRIAIDRDGTIFMTLGDRDYQTPWLVAQDMGTHLGKIIHVTPEGAPAPGNPFRHVPGALPEIWALGLRSPQGLAFDRNHVLWETEHGPRGGDELNRIEKGRNYGWPVITYGTDYPGGPVGAGLTAKAGMEQPVYYWDPTLAPSGLAFYDAPLFAHWKNSVLIGGLSGRMLERLTLADGKVAAEEPLLTDLDMRIRDVRVGADGAVYVLAGLTTLLKLTPR